MKELEIYKKYIASDILSVSGKEKLTQLVETHFNAATNAAFFLGQQSQQARIDELEKQKKILLDEIYLMGDAIKYQRVLSILRGEK